MSIFKLCFPETLVNFFAGSLHLFALNNSKAQIFASGISVLFHMTVISKMPYFLSSYLNSYVNSYVNLKDSLEIVKIEELSDAIG